MFQGEACEAVLFRAVPNIVGGRVQSVPLVRIHTHVLLVFVPDAVVTLTRGGLHTTHTTDTLLLTHTSVCYTANDHRQRPGN